MTIDQDRRDRARIASQAGRFGEAIEIYRSLWNVDGPRDLWDARGLVSALRKCGEFEEAIAIGKEALAIDPSFDPVLSEVSWSLWQFKIKGVPTVVGDETVAEVLRLRGLAQDPYSQYAAFTRSLLDIVKADLERKLLVRADSLTDILDPQNIDGTANQFDGKSLPSDRQRFYTLRGKTLKAMRRWPELEQFADGVATDREIQWTNKGDVWIARWRIEAISEQGRVEDAISLTESLLKRLDEWYVHADLAKYLWRIGRRDSALVEALKAARGPGDFEFKVNVFKLAATLLAEMARLDLARSFVQATIAIRDFKGWPEDVEATQLCERIGWERPTADLRTAQHQVEEAISSLLEEFDPPMGGEVTKLFAEGKSGFITDDQGVGRYFTAREVGFRGDRLREGLRVKFRPTVSYDKKKNRDSPAAADIRLDE